MIVGASHMNDKIVVWITDPKDRSNHIEAVLSLDEARRLYRQLEHHTAMARIDKGPLATLKGAFA